MKNRVFDTVVIGGGASGLTAAIFAARGGCKVLVLEQKDKLCKKIYATGNGKCNFTNKNCNRLTSEEAILPLRSRCFLRFLWKILCHFLRKSASTPRNETAIIILPRNRRLPWQRVWYVKRNGSVWSA